MEILAVLGVSPTIINDPHILAAADSPPQPAGPVILVIFAIRRQLCIIYLKKLDVCFGCVNFLILLLV